MIIAKKPIDCALSVITSAKAAFTNLKNVTLFVVDINLQYFMAQGGKNKQHYKDVPCEGVQSGTIMGIFNDENEFCAPAYGNLEKGSQIIFT